MFTLALLKVTWHWVVLHSNRLHPQKGCGGNAVSSVEDPEKMLEQTVNEMQSDLIKMRQASAQARPRTLLRYNSYLLGCLCAQES